jgi:hypothetical protein
MPFKIKFVVLALNVSRRMLYDLESPRNIRKFYNVYFLLVKVKRHILLEPTRTLVQKFRGNNIVSFFLNERYAEKIPNFVKERQMNIFLHQNC